MKKKSVELQIVDDQLPFVAYQLRGYEFGMILALEKDVYPFLYNFFTNIYGYREVWKKFDHTFEKMCWFQGYDDMFEKRVVWFNTRKLKKQKGCINKIRQTIDAGLYGYGHFDEYYIPNKQAFEKYHFEHSFFLFGYDDFERVFLAVGYTDKGKFERYKISYDSFFNGFSSQNHWVMVFRRPRPEFDYVFDISIFCNELDEYLSGIYTGNLSSDNERYGIEARDGFRQYVNEKVNELLPLDIRYSRFFLEHTSFMKERLNYLYVNGYTKKTTQNYTQRLIITINVSICYLSNIICKNQKKTLLYWM